MKYALVTLEVEIHDGLVYDVETNKTVKNNIIAAARAIGKPVAIAVDDEPAEKEIVDVWEAPSEEFEQNRMTNEGG